MSFFPSWPIEFMFCCPYNPGCGEFSINPGAEPTYQTPHRKENWLSSLRGHPRPIATQLGVGLMNPYSRLLIDLFSCKLCVATPRALRLWERRSSSSATCGRHSYTLSLPDPCSLWGVIFLKKKIMLESLHMGKTIKASEAILATFKLLSQEQ